jgi:hypothetical protein
MGLDILEMVMALEREFQVRLPDEELRSIRTLGEVYECILRHLPPDQVPSSGNAYEGALWERYLDVVERDTGVDRRRLRPTATFVWDLGLQ